jgi:carboxyl-terminal processing protease
MRRTVTSVYSALVAAVVLACAGGTIEAQVRVVSPSPASNETPAVEVDGVLRRGQQLESERRWGEAVALYEEALRENPGAQGLATHHEQAKIHYDLGRRYHDASFLRSLGTMSEREALALYGEVLLKIQSHYVSEPDWAALVRRGTAGLEVALNETTFASKTSLHAARPQIDAFRQQLAREVQTRSPRSRQQAIDCVAAIARLGQSQLHIASTALVLEYACGATAGLDEYSSFLTGDQLTDVYSQIEGNFVGLGIELKAAEGSLLIVKVIGNSPAERAGIRAQDRIVAVGGHSTAELNTDQAADLLQGTEGSVVEVVVQTTGSEPRKLTVRREHVDVPSVDDVKIVDADYGVGYVKLTCFQKTTSRDLDAALWKLHRQGMRSLIVDLRGNPGGLLTASVEVVDKFVEDGIIVSTRGRSALEDYNYTAHKAGTWPVPLVVLIDGDSASASEIFAGAIRDHRRGTIIGQRSYGKGSVQGIFPLTVAGAGVRLTTAKFYSPSGNPISKVGVHPDVAVRRADKPAAGQPVSTADDEVLAAGLQVARRQTAKR